VISVTNIDAGKSLDYKNLYRGNGAYVFVIDGHINIEGESLHSKDALGIWEADAFSFTAERESVVLCLEVPMDGNTPVVS
jgi:redox-sensitive bicupin YhaK (pirin superfamily)